MKRVTPSTEPVSPEFYLTERHLPRCLYTGSSRPRSARGINADNRPAKSQGKIPDSGSDPVGEDTFFAQQRDSSSTAVRISSLLGNLTLSDIATCPDEVRSFEQRNTPLSTVCAQIFPNPPKGTAPWHFVNTPIKAAPFTPTATDVAAACKNNCVTVKITSFLAVLRAARPTDSKAKKLAELQALSFVVHFIGDIHQPLHAAQRDNDAGGNAEHIKFFGTDDGGTLVLHTIWDRQIVSLIDADPAKLATDLQPEISLAKSEQPGTPVTWAIQSYLPRAECRLYRHSSRSDRPGPHERRRGRPRAALPGLGGSDRTHTDCSCGHQIGRCAQAGAAVD